MAFTNKDVQQTQTRSLAKETFQITAGLATRTILQAIVFVGIARLLGVDAFGAFAALLALAGSIGQLGGLGCQIVMIRRVSRDVHAFDESWRITLLITAVSAPILFSIYLLLAYWLAPDAVGWGPILLIGVAEVVFAPTVVVAISAFQAHGAMGPSSTLIAAPAVSRFVGIIAFWPITAFFQRDDLLVVWSVIYVFGSLGAMLYAFLSVQRQLSPASALKVSSWQELCSIAKAGFPFAIGGLGLRLYADIDKTMLGRMDTLHATGSYAASYRIAEFIILPVHALFISALPRLFRASTQGADALELNIKTLWLTPIAYTVTAAVVVWASAPWLPLVLGNSFQAAVEPLRWMAWLPIVTLPRLHWQQRLVAMDRHNSVVVIILAGAIFNILMNFWLIPLASWKGAVISTYLAEGVMVLAMLSISTSSSLTYSKKGRLL